MKFRLKIKEFINGSKLYFPQYKIFLFWHYFEDEYWCRINSSDKKEMIEYIEDYKGDQLKKVTYENYGKI